MPIEPEYHTHDVHGNDLSEQNREFLEQERHNRSIHGTEKTNWKTKHSMEAYQTDLRRIGGLIDPQSWERIFDDRFERKISIIQIPNRKQEKWARRVGEHGLSYRLIQYTAPFDGFRHSTQEAHPINPDKISRAVVGQSEDAVERAIDAFESHNAIEKNEIIGELLGYSECCRDFFNDCWVEKEVKDPIYEMACNTSNIEVLDEYGHEILVEDLEPWCNVLWRYWGWTFLDHIPCSFDCEGSIENAKNKMEWAKEEGFEQEVETLYDWLSMPTEWSGMRSLARISNPHLIGSANSSLYWNKKTVIWNDRPPQESMNTDEYGAYNV